MRFTKKDLIALCLKEGWEVDKIKIIDSKNDKPVYRYVVYANDQQVDLNHPFYIHLKFYRESIIPEIRFQSMCRAHDLLWPQFIPTNNYWMYERFWVHVADGRDSNPRYSQIVFTSGAGTGKSVDCAKIGCLFWLSKPTEHACIVATTTIASAKKRIWGYVNELMNKTAIPLDYEIKGNPPKCVTPVPRGQQADEIHSMLVVAAKEGDSDRAIRDIIGHHPKKGILVILDECTDLNIELYGSMDNLEQGVEFCQIIGVGNAKDKDDLHGSMATPENGWDSVDPDTDRVWYTKHENRNGVCLFFHPYDSPAIHEKDPVKKDLLGKFLMTEEKITKKVKKFGANSEGYYRFVLGFWRKQEVDKYIVTRNFLEEHKVQEPVHWAGYYKLLPVAGLDTAIKAEGKGCVLRFGIMGVDVKGNVVVDFRSDELLHYIHISRHTSVSAERQLCEQVLEYLMRYDCSLQYLAIDSTGLGRMCAELIRTVYANKSGIPYEQVPSPMKVMSSRSPNAKVKEDPNLHVIPPYEQWVAIRQLMSHHQLKGLDMQAFQQLSKRKVINKNGKMFLEEKEEYISRMRVSDPENATSPDEADAMALALQVAIHRRGLRLGKKAEIIVGEDVNDVINEKMRAARAIHNVEQQEQSQKKGLVRVPVARFTSGWSRSPMLV
jgi:hypothetical protein